MKINKKIILIILYMSAFFYVFYRFGNDFYLMDKEAVWDFNLFDKELSYTIIQQIVITSFYGILIGLLDMSIKRKITHLWMIILILKFCPALFQRGVFDIQTFVILISVATAFVAISDMILNKILKYISVDMYIKVSMKQNVIILGNNKKHVETKI